MNNINLNIFSKNDWYGFAGAESFHDGDPLIAHVHVPGWPEAEAEGETTLICDASGITFTGVDGFLVVLIGKALGKLWNASTAKAIISTLPEDATFQNLLDLGFEPANFPTPQESPLKTVVRSIMSKTDPKGVAK